MNQKMRFAYILALIVSVLLYVMPFQYGGNLLRGLLALGILMLLGTNLKGAWSDFAQAERIPVALLLMNGLAFLHFALIFIVIVFNPRALILLILGIILAFPTFLVVDNRMKEHLN